MIVVGTSFTEGYPWAEAYVASLKRHAQGIGVARNLYSIEHRRPEADAFWLPDPGTRGKMAQHGAFLDYGAEYVDHNPVLVFTDADMLMQRPFTAEEISNLETVGPGEVWLGQNLFEDQTLEEEATLIQPSKDFEHCDELFPGWREMDGRNCGVIVARQETYERLYDLTRALLPACYFCFNGTAAIQWLICYCVQRWLELRELPRTIHVHGHVDPGPDVTFTADGNAWVKETVQVHPLGGRQVPAERKTLAVFRHALNLDPEKNWSSPEWREYLAQGKR